MEIRDKILNFPEQLLKGLELAKNIKVEKTYEKVIICGMGGSILAGELLVFWQEITGMPPVFSIHRDYDLPSWISENDLVICISWSGNTEETISSYNSALDNNISVISMATGGKLNDLAVQNKTPLILIPHNNLKPRMGIGYMTAALFQLVGLADNISDIKLDSEVFENDGKKISEELTHNTIPLLYSSYKWRVIPKFWKILFNENDKIHAFWNYLPAMAHNELAGFSEKDQRKFVSIFFKDLEDDKRQNKNIDSAIAILNKLSYNYSIVNISPSNKPLEAVFNSYILGLWTSYYLAKKIGIDPEEINVIEEYKKLKSYL